MKTVAFDELQESYGSVEHDATAESVLLVVDELLQRIGFEIVQGESFDDCHQFEVRTLLCPFKLKKLEGFTPDGEPV